MTRQEEVKLAEAKKANPSAGRAALSSITGISQNKVRAWLLRRGKSNDAQAYKKAGRSIAEFRATYDKSTIVPAKIKEGIKALTHGGWEYEAQFVKLAGITHSDLGNFRDQFAEFIVVMKDRRVWVGSVKTAKLMREML